MPSDLKAAHSVLYAISCNRINQISATSYRACAEAAPKTDVAQLTGLLLNRSDEYGNALRTLIGKRPGLFSVWGEDGSLSAGIRENGAAAR